MIQERINKLEDGIWKYKNKIEKKGVKIKRTEYMRFESKIKWPYIL